MSKKLNLQQSKELFRSGRELVPGGVIGVRRPAHFIPNEYPIYLLSACKGHVTDVDGNEFVDLTAAYGATLLGYRESEVDGAVMTHIQEHGVCMTLTQPVQNDLASNLVRIIPCCEKVIAVKTGSDATLAAIRIARAHTGRTKILRCGYHGWHDWSVEVKSGIPEILYEDSVEFRFNDLDQVRELFSHYRDDVAGIILWPIHTPLGGHVENPTPGFLQELRLLADEYGSVLIFDEMRTGFRVSLGGAQERFGVTPDIALFGKAMGNGYPIAVVAGNSRVMKAAENKVFISSTYFADPIGQVAANKTIEILQNTNILSEIKQKGERLASELDSVLAASPVPASYTGGPWFPHILFGDSSEKLNFKLRLLFYSYLVRSGVLLSPYHHGFLIHKHTKEDLERVVTVVAEGLDTLARDYYS